MHGATGFATDSHDKADKQCFRLASTHKTVLFLITVKKQHSLITQNTNHTNLFPKLKNTIV